MPHLAIALLGAPRVAYDGVPIAVDTRKATALLAYLAVVGGTHSRDALATLFWSEYDGASARGALRRTLSALNRTPAGGWLAIDRTAVGLRRDPDLVIDVERFGSLLAASRAHDHPPAEPCDRCLAMLDEAAAFYRGDFLAGFTLRDSPGFDDWQAFQTEGLRRELAAVLEALARGHAARGAFEGAIATARRWLALDPLHEPAHRTLMLAYAGAGQHAAALRQYRECVRILDRELGVAPLEETTMLYGTILERRAPPPVSPPVRVPAPATTEETPRGGAGLSEAGPAPGAPSARPPAYPLVGRAAEWAALRDTYGAIGPDGRLIVLEGEAGVGKTRLAEEFLAHAAASGTATLALRCFPGEGDLAFGPFSEGLRDIAAGPAVADRLRATPAHWLAEAARLRPELAALRADLAPAPPLDGPGAQGRFFEGIRQVLLTAIGGGSVAPGLLFLDDLHWADAATLDLLTYLLRRLRGWPLGVLATWRSEEAPAGGRLRRLLAEVERAGGAAVVPLARLDRAAVQVLARDGATMGLRAPGTLAGNGTALGDWLWAETEGLPFFLIEYLRALAGGAEVGIPLPRGVADLLRSRLATVSETGTQLLATAAAIGRAFDFETLRAVSGRGEDEAVVALDALLAAGLVREVPGAGGGRDPGYDFCHEKLRVLVYEETSLARRRLLHRRIADVLAAPPHGAGRDANALAPQIAHHYQLAGQEADAATFFRLAGDRARRLYANAEALAQYRAALALGHPDEAALREAIGELHTLTGEYGAALAAFEGAAATLATPEEQTALARLERKLGALRGRRGEWDLAEGHFRAALSALDLPGIGGSSGAAGERAALLADWSLTAHQRGEAERAVALAREVLTLAETGGDGRALAQAHNLLGILAGGRGDRAAARHHLEHSAVLAEGLGDTGARAAALNNLALTLGAEGETDRAVALAEAALALCVARGDRHREAALHNNLADLLHAGGRAAAAIAHLKRAVAIYAEIGVEAGAVQPQIWKLAEW